MDVHAVVEVDRKQNEPNFLGPHSVFLVPDWQLGFTSSIWCQHDYSFSRG